MLALRKLEVVTIAALMLTSRLASATDRYVAVNGNDSGNDCTKETSPCKTIGHAIQSMTGGDTVIVGDGTYSEPIRDMPSGTAAAYTTIRAKNDWGVTIDGSGFENNFTFGVRVASKSYVTIRGLRIKMNQANDNNEPIIVENSDHVKIQRCAASHAPTDGNSSSIDIGPAAKYVLVEECYAFGGGRYQFLVFESEHVVVRRSVARVDHWTGTLQCAGFTNYDSADTTWQNNIVLDSDTANCSGRLYGGFFNENKVGIAPDTSQKLQGNIVLNVNAFYAGDLDWLVTGTRTISDLVIWGSSGGYYGNQGEGMPATINATRLTIGAISGTYDGLNEGPAHGTGFSVYGNVPNTVTSSLFTKNASFGVADHTSSDFNAFFGNGASYGGVRTAVAGPNDRSPEKGNAIDPITSGSLKYLPHIEVGSPLKTAGKDGGQIGAEITYMTGETGTLNGEPGWDVVTTTPLWPFPNEAKIKEDMGAYAGPGAKGARGFAVGKSLDGTDQTLTKYVWEALGNQIPAEIYGGGSVEPPPVGGPNPNPAGPSVDGGGAPNGASGGGAAGADDDGGCGCRAAPPAYSVPSALLGVGGASILARRRRRRNSG